MENYVTHSEVVQVTKMDATCSNMPERFKGVVGEPNKWLIAYRGAIKPVFMTDGEFKARHFSKVIDCTVHDGTELKHLPTKINHKLHVVDDNGKTHTYYLQSELYSKMDNDKERRLENQVREMEEELGLYRAADRVITALLGPDSIADTPLEKAEELSRGISQLNDSGIIHPFFAVQAEPDDHEIINDHWKKRNERIHLVEIEESKRNYTKEKENGRAKKFGVYENQWERGYSQIQ